ncbi:MAG: lectin-like protein [Planctomycetota bacterium]
MRPIRLSLAVSFLVPLAATSSAAPQTRNPVNGNHYLYVADALTWTDARTAAEGFSFMGAPGHLVTLADANEDEFVFDLFINASAPGTSCWIGASQNTSSPTYAEPSDGYEWVTGEPFDYVNWATNEPNNASLGQDFVEMWDVAAWNDTNDFSGLVGGYIVEFDTADGPFLNPANGHLYDYVPGSRSFADARAAAEALVQDGAPGNLVTITSAAENEFVVGVLESVGAAGTVWLGALQDPGAPGFSEPAGGWTWLTGEPFTYSNWGAIEPNDDNVGEDFIEMLTNGVWNDANDLFTINQGFVVEFVPPVPFGDTHCTSLPNSTGVHGTLVAVGSPIAALNDVTLRASNLPPLQFGIFVCSEFGGSTPVAEGVLCVGPSNIGRYFLPSQILQSSATGSFSLEIDLATVPTATAQVSLQPGDTWHFQAWHRDFASAGPTANFTDGLRITLQ